MSNGIRNGVCTCFREDGRTRCGNRGRVCRVITKNRAGQTLNKHWACDDCRDRMKLPAYGVVLSPLGMRPYLG